MRCPIGLRSMGSNDNLDKLVPEPAIRSCDSGQHIPCFDSCQLTIIWMSIIKLNTGHLLLHWLGSLIFHIGFLWRRRTGGQTDVRSRD